MIRSLLAWLDHRTGYRGLLHELLHERIPGGARWRYVWGSTLMFVFAIQVITGICLWSAYSPGVQNAWASVLYLQEVLAWGWLIRGLHHYAAQAMVVLLAVHFVQVVWDGAYRAPREINFWIGLVMMQLVMGLALTGYLLPWDQKGYYATQVATKILGATPLVGAAAQRLVIGGPDYGQQTLTRFFALHAGVLPGLLGACAVVHLYLFRRHGITAKVPYVRAEESFWPGQVAKDACACLAVLVLLLILAWGRPVELAAPADPAEPYAAARPEWYFLSLFRLLKFEAVEHLGLVFGAIVIPGIAMTYLVLMPLIAHFRGGHTLNRAVTVALLSSVVGLTGLAWFEDRGNPEHQAAIHEADRDAARARELALGPGRVPAAGPNVLLAEDPRTQGPRLFARHCASCHRFSGHDGRGREILEMDAASGERRAALATAPDLGNLGSTAWMRAVLLDFPAHFAPIKNASWFGKEEGIDPDNSEMADWSGDRAALNSPQNAANIEAVVDYLRSESGIVLPTDKSQSIAAGRKLATEGGWSGGLDDVTCTNCHASLGSEYKEEGEDGAGYPDIAGYLSAPWLRDFIRDPGHVRFYGDKNRMPAFAERLSAEELELLVRWLRENAEETTPGNPPKALDTKPAPTQTLPTSNGH